MAVKLMGAYPARRAPIGHSGPRAGKQLRPDTQTGHLQRGHPRMMGSVT